jgi:hypothetical protein
MSYYEDCWNALQEERKKWHPCPACGEKHPDHREGELCDECVKCLRRVKIINARGSIDDWIGHGEI